MTFPDLSPIAFFVFGWPVRWYGLAYFFGILGAWQYCKAILPAFPGLKERDLDDLIPWAIVGIVVGGRLGYVCLYAPDYFWAHPWEIFQVWRGGMAFHGGLLGVGFALLIYGARHSISWLSLGDCLACGSPIALFLGRLGNLINQEVYGRPTEMPWGVVFPKAGPLTRHPSQIYEALLEGIVLFLLLRFALPRLKRCAPGTMMGIFCIGYGVARFFCEIFREPDGLWSWKFLTITSGQLFSVPLFFIGVLFFSLNLKDKKV
jgi:phosphatidylglycerol:prolipoprotein diacylglycerol transferase